ncbi:MAG: hypothetical protein U0V75_04495 [Ferruginibacter sp.]
MKKIFLIKPVIAALFTLCLAMAINGCKKDSDGSPDYKAGDPSSSSVSPTTGGGGTAVTIQGAGLGQMRTIVFDKNNVPAPFVTTLNSENSIIFRVPDTAFGGAQNIVLTNVDGKTLKVPFNVIALPGVSTAFPTDFQANSLVTLTGINLEAVTAVVFDGTSTACTIVSQSRKQMVIRMPSTTITRGKLKLTNSSGDKVTDMEFVNVDQAQCVFKDDFTNGFQNWGWGGTYAPGTADKITGTACMNAAFDPAGSWGGLQMGGGAINTTGYKYFSFWVKGADVDKNMQFWINWSNQKVFTIPANKWTYFRYELAVDFPGTTNVDNVTFQIHNEGKTILFDNIMFFK